MFFGTTFAGTDSALSNSTVMETPVTSFVLKNMVLDELYATKDILVHFSWKIPSDWNFNTILHALYKGNTFAGNVDFDKDIVSKIKIKKRFKGDFEWKTIYEKEIVTNDDFNIELYDYYEPSNRDIEYSYVAVIANTDTEGVFTEVHSRFDSYFICDADEIYPLRLNTTNDVTYNRESSTLVSPGSKYPYVVHNGIAKYYSGKLDVLFIEMKDGKLDAENGWKYRNKIDQFLTDGKAKIIKSFEGDMWMVNIVGSLPRTNNGYYQLPSHQIEWVECGDPTKVADLYDNGFIDTDTDRE